MFVDGDFVRIESFINKKNILGLFIYKFKNYEYLEFWISFILE